MIKKEILKKVRNEMREYIGMENANLTDAKEMLHEWAREALELPSPGKLLYADTCCYSKSLTYGNMTVEMSVIGGDSWEEPPTIRIKFSDGEKIVLIIGSDKDGNVKFF